MSDPYVSMASTNPIRLNGALDATLYRPYLAKMGGNTSSIIPNTSSWVAKLISMSSW